MPWPTRGLRDGIVTTRYPAHRDDYGASFRSAIQVRVLDSSGNGAASLPAVDALCPTGAIGPAPAVRVDRGRCILCARCTTAFPHTFAFDSSIEVATLTRRALVVPDVDDEDLEQLRAAMRRRVRGLRRSVHIRHVDAGSDGSDEWEVAALTNPIYDVQRLGIFFTATPRHADILLVTGAGARGMQEPVLRTLKAMPTPTAVIAAGTDAVSGGLIAPTYATTGGVGEWLPVDVWVPGSPPSPFSLLHAILLALDLLPREGAR